MDEYRGLAVFVAVAHAGSFSGAARRLKLSTSVVSHHVSKLEEKLGIALFFRSTRSLSLTPEGDAILPPARKMVDAAQEALDILNEANEQPVGTLRVTLPAFGENTPVHKALWRFARTYPLVSLSFHTSDQQVDLIKEGFNLAIRLGHLSDSTMKSRRIGSFKRSMVASPAYLADRAKIKTIEDLQKCDFIAMAMLADTITLVCKDEQISFEPENIRMEVHSVTAAKSAVLEGFGVQHLPLSDVEQELKDGSLVEILPNWTLPVLGIYAIWPDIGPQKKLTRRLIDFLIAEKI